MQIGREGIENMLVNMVLQNYFFFFFEDTNFFASLLQNGLNKFKFGTFKISLELKVILSKTKFDESL